MRDSLQMDVFTNGFTLVHQDGGHTLSRRELFAEFCLEETIDPLIRCALPRLFMIAWPVELLLVIPVPVMMNQHPVLSQLQQLSC